MTHKYKRYTTKFIADFSTETMEARRQWNNSLSAERKIVNQEFHIQGEI